ncbi:shikimate kinase [Ilumatobacter nonamiensis]|uniref:shikimate kinase n=1 Tax=Ilumatobacter nonamiensis TaxID=467093 RepID=UPI0003492CB8|nr:shikimate kinase [Ilumatobacter nonamiensis]
MNTCTDRHLVLVGMMGAGKSSVGRVLARRLDRELFDSDEMIEARAGRTVREIWRDEGEPVFRQLETDVLGDAIAAEEPSIIAAAGGVVLSDENREVLKGSGAHVVWLLADVDLLLERVRNGMHRPLLDDDPEGTLRRMYEERSALYQDVADAIVSVDNRSVHDVAGAVLRCAG